MIVLKVINRYLFKELLAPFFASLLTFSAIMLMGRTLRLADLVVNKGLGIIELLQLISFIFIPFLGYIIPMSLLLTVLLALGRLSADNEITAMKSSGISLYQIVIPIGVFTCGAFILTTILTVYAYPWGFRSLRNFAFKVAKTQSEAGIQERVFNDDFEGMVIYIDRTAPAGPLKGVFISDKRDPDMSTTIVAKEGHITSDPVSMTVHLRLLDGNFHRAGNDLQSYQMGRFATYDITLDLKSSFNELKRQKKKIREMTIAELKHSIAGQEHRTDELNEIKVEYYKKFTIPFACFVFGLLGIPLGIRKVRGGKSYGFIVSLVIIVIYYLLLITAEAVAKSGAIPPLISMWLPNITLGVLGLYLFNHAARESTSPIFILVNRLQAEGISFLKNHFLRGSSMTGSIDMPQTCSLIKEGTLTLLIKNAFKETLIRQGILKPHRLITTHHKTGKQYVGRGVLPAIEIQEGTGKRMVAKQCMRGGLLRFINKDLFWGGMRPFREMIANEHILKRGIKTTEILAAAQHRVFGPFYRTYLFSLELPECADLIAFFEAVRGQPPPQRFRAKVPLIKAVAGALAAMHREGIYHRDLHLKNILIERCRNSMPEIFIIDFDRAVCKNSLTSKERLKNLLRLNRSIEKYKTRGGAVTRGDQCRLFKEYFILSGEPSELFHKNIKRYGFLLKLRKALWKMETLITRN